MFEDLPKSSSDRGSRGVSVKGSAPITPEQEGRGKAMVGAMEGEEMDVDDES